MLQRIREKVFIDDSAMQADNDFTKGGIDFNPDLLDLQIKRDEEGLPLPLPQQPVEMIDIDGFIPVIINIAPVPSIPLLMGRPFADPEADPVNTAQDDPYNVKN